LKWAGGKRQLLGQIEALLPKEFGTYHEPFLGGGALFFHLGPGKAFLSDKNSRLIRTYRGIQKNVDAVIRILETHKNERDYYLETRQIPIDVRDDIEVAAWFIFLNKTGYNGLYRVNKNNGFNVPFGENRNARFYDANNLHACAKALVLPGCPPGEVRVPAGARRGVPGAAG